MKRNHTTDPPQYSKSPLPPAGKTRADSRWCAITHTHIHISFPAAVIIRQCVPRLFGRISSFIQQMWGPELLAVPCCCIHTWPIRPGLKHCGCSNCLSLCRPVCRFSSLNKCAHVCKYSRGDRERGPPRGKHLSSSFQEFPWQRRASAVSDSLVWSKQHGGSPARKLGTWRPQLRRFRKIMSGRESAEAFDTVILKETYHRENTHTEKKEPWRWSEAENASASERIGNHRRFYFHNSLSSFTAPLTTAFLFSRFGVKLCLLNRSLGFVDVVCSTL